MELDVETSSELSCPKLLSNMKESGEDLSKIEIRKKTDPELLNVSSVNIAYDI